MNVLVINGHPRKDSFSEALARAYVNGAESVGVCVEQINLYEQPFDLNITERTPRAQDSEPFLIHARELILWCNHIVFVYPTWWGTMPAMLKGFIDRTFTRGFAFEEIEGGTGYAPLLKGRSAQILTTMDTPYFVYNFIYGAPGHKAMKNATLAFCGFQMAGVIAFGPVRDSKPDQREAWLARTRDKGARLKTGALSARRKLSIKLFAWLKALRLQFYPMTFVAYALGAYASTYAGYGFRWDVFWVGYVWIFCLEVATVLINEYVDYRTDFQNKYFGPFTGGSRIIVDGDLHFSEVKQGIAASLLGSGIMFLLILTIAGGSILPMLFSSLVLTILALGYTAPPLKLSYRGLGEMTVGITHSLAVIMCGYVFMGGNVLNAIPWIIGMPLFLSVLPSIILAGIPDYDADKAVGKRTLSVLLGRKTAAKLALGMAWTAAAAVLMFDLLQVHPQVFHNLLWFVVPHLLIFTFQMRKYLKMPDTGGRIDVLILIALSYMIWFGLIPLINL